MVPKSCGRAGRKQGCTVTAGLKKGLDSRVRGCGGGRVQRRPQHPSFEYLSPFVSVTLASLRHPNNPLKNEVREGKEGNNCPQAASAVDLRQFPPKQNTGP